VARLHLVIPGDLTIRTGGYRYDRRIVDGLRARGLAVEVHALGPGFPFPDAAARARAAAAFAAIPDGAAVVADGLAFGVLAEQAAEHAARLDVAALVHHPLALETGLDDETRRRLFGQERAALALARRCIVTSRHTARALADYGVPAAAIAVVEPGTDPAPLAAGSGGPLPHLVCVATLTPRKGHAVLLEALAAVRDLPWRLTCAGGTQHDPATAAAVRAQADRLGLADRVQFAGELDDAALDRLYDTADLAVLASHYEGYGMVLTEAIARGIPVVATAAGAVADTVPPRAGLLVPPGDAPALADALRRVLGDASARAVLAEGARAARARLPDWPEQAARFAAALGLPGLEVPA